MKDKEIGDELRAALEDLEKYTGHDARVEAINRLRQVLAAVEANPPLAEVEKWVMVQVGKENLADMCLRNSRCWDVPPANDPDVWLPSYAFMPVTVTIRGK